MSSKNIIQCVKKKDTYYSYINPNKPIKLQGCCIIKNPIETDLSGYIDVPKLFGYMINLSKKQVINKRSRRIQKVFINLSKNKKNKLKCNWRISYEQFLKEYM